MSHRMSPFFDNEKRKKSDFSLFLLILFIVLLDFLFLFYVFICKVYPSAIQDLEYKSFVSYGFDEMICSKVIEFFASWAFVDD